MYVCMCSGRVWRTKYDVVKIVLTWENCSHNHLLHLLENLLLWTKVLTAMSTETCSILAYHMDDRISTEQKPDNQNSNLDKFGYQFDSHVFLCQICQESAPLTYCKVSFSSRRPRTSSNRARKQLSLAVTCISRIEISVFSNCHLGMLHR